MATPTHRAEGKRLMLALGITVITAGMCISAVGAWCDLSDARLDYSVDWESLAVFGVFITAAGVGLSSKAMLGPGVPLWRVRDGERGMNPLAVVMLCLGIAAMTFESGFLAFAALLDFPLGPVGTHLTLILVTAILVTVGFATRYRPQSMEGGSEGTTRRMRMATGAGLMATGIILQTAALLIGDGVDGGLNSIYVLWMFVAGLVLELSGLSAVLPQGRAWVEGGTLNGP
ncbi:MAG: hypothetical protein MUE55_08850 [Thermoplasmata archaeon]|nr:hypothetical protein [Thermoplasmata archaeon]